MARRNVDGGIWRLTWERTPEGEYRAWVVTEPSVWVSGPDWDDVEESLYTAIDETLHAGEWTADWEPHPPALADDGIRVDDEYVILVGEGSYSMLSDPDGLFENGVCRRCGSGLGNRTPVQLTVYVERPAGILSQYGSGPSGIELFRHKTLKALHPHHTAGAVPRPVRRVGRGWSRYSELSAPAGPGCVGIQGEEMFGWRCSLCRSTRFSQRYKQASYRSLVRESQVPRGRPAFWFRHPEPSLCVNARWWREHRLTPPFRGVISWALWVIRDDLAADEAVLRDYPEGRDQYARYIARQDDLRKTLGVKRPS